MAPFIAPAELSSTPAEFQTMVKQSPALDINILKTWAHSPATIELAARWGKAQFSSLALSPTMRELAILQTGVLCRSDYELAQHVPMALAVGCTQQQVERLVQNGAEEGFFSSTEATAIIDERELVLLQWVAEIEHQPTTSARILQAVKKHFTDREMVEILTVVGFYRMIARLTTVLQIDIDEVDGLEVMKGFQGIAALA